MATAPSWITFDKISGTGNATVKVQAAGNMFPSIRSGSFSVKTTDNSVTREVSVSQNPLKTDVTINLQLTVQDHGSPSGDGYNEYEYRVMAVANSTVRSNITVRFTLGATGSTSYSVVIPNGYSGSDEISIYDMKQGSGQENYNASILSLSPIEDTYHTYYPGSVITGGGE